jgi:hypothetical protein
MHFLIVFRIDERSFSFEEIREFVDFTPEFSNLRFSEPGGAALEAVFTSDPDRTIVRLSGDLETVTISGESPAALEVAIALQKAVRSPLRLIDCDYTFDLRLQEYTSVDDLAAAIALARSQ